MSCRAAMLERKAGGARAERPINIEVDVDTPPETGRPLSLKLGFQARSSFTRPKIHMVQLHAREPSSQQDQAVSKASRTARTSRLCSSCSWRRLIVIEWAVQVLGRRICSDTMRPFLIRKPTKCTGLVDENLSKDEQIELRFETARYALHCNWARVVHQQPGETRGRSGLWQHLQFQEGNKLEVRRSHSRARVGVLRMPWFESCWIYDVKETLRGARAVCNFGHRAFGERP